MRRYYSCEDVSEPIEGCARSKTQKLSLTGFWKSDPSLGSSLESL